MKLAFDFHFVSAIIIKGAKLINIKFKLFQSKMQGFDISQFGDLSGMFGGAASGPKPLVEFKAGKMHYDGRMVKPDRRKGILRVIKDFQGMNQFQFVDADTKNPIDSFYVFPGDAKFEKVKQSKDRVYLLEFSSTS